MELKKDNVCLRPWLISDLDDLVKHANNFEIAKNMMDQFPHPYTIEKAKVFIGNASASNPTNIFAIEFENHAVGAIGIHPQSDIQRLNAELGYWLGQEYWGKGIMTRAIELITTYTFNNFDIIRIFARPFGSNYASRRALEKAGYTLEGRFDKTFIKNEVLQDELIYAIRKS